MPAVRRLAVVLALMGLVAVGCTKAADGPAAATEPAASGERAGGEEARAGQAHDGGLSAEAEEEAEALQERIEAFERAKEPGRAGVAEAITADPAPGWSGEYVVNARKDDWEPAIAADPNGPYVYLLVTRIGERKICKGNCPRAFIALERSTDNGRTWSKARPLCACKGSWQYDPQIEVVPETGDIYAAYLNGFNTVFMKSSDHGKTWSAPVKTYGKVSWTDKPALAMSDNGKNVYISFNGPTGGDPFVAQSHDYGKTWTQRKLVDSKRYYFAFDADVLHDGTVIFSESGITYTGPGASPEGVVRHVAFISRDAGRHWDRVVVDTVKVGEACVSAGCSPDFYIGHDAVSADDRGNLVYLYDGARRELGPQRIYARTSLDEGATWSRRVALSVAGENATMPAVESRNAGDVRAWYMQTANNDDRNAWNVWFRSSSDGGRTWSARVKISDATSGARYKTPAGFKEPYGDYGEICITSTGKVIAAWGEGFSWIGPGGVWINRQL
jgi:BNR repeat-like domain